MKVLYIHNRYKILGGEDSVFEVEVDMLRTKGCEVKTILLNNNEIDTLGKKIGSFFSAIYSFKSKKLIAREILEFKPDVIHVHNFFPLVSPSIYDLAKKLKVPIVQTLHNYRLICPGALLLREGVICEKCVNGNFSNAIINRCYKQSILGSTSVAIMDWFHRISGTWNNKIDRIICLTEFARNKFVEAGFNKDKIVVKPNFVTAEIVPVDTKRENIGLFVGRISSEKGIEGLVKIHDRLKGKLLIVGDGPELDKLRGLKSFDLLGFKKNDEVKQLMQQVSFLVFPSIWYEGLPMTILEAFSNKLPVIATNIGAMSSVVENHRNGLHFELSNYDQMIDQINWAFCNYESIREFGEAAYDDYQNKYSMEINYQKQIKIYQDVIDERKGK